MNRDIAVTRTENADRARITAYAVADGMGTFEVVVVTAYHPDLRRYVSTVRRDECEGIILTSQPVERFNTGMLDELHACSNRDAVEAMRLLTLQSV